MGAVAAALSRAVTGSGPPGVFQAFSGRRGVLFQVYLALQASLPFRRGMFSFASHLYLISYTIHLINTKATVWI